MSRIQSQTKAVTSPAAAGSATTVIATNLVDYDAIEIEASLVGATGGTLDVYVQRSFDGTTWVDYVRYTQLAAAASAVRYSVSPTLDGTINAVGTGTSPALAQNTCANGHWGDQLRVLCVAGSGTSAGAALSFTVNCWLRKI